MLAGAALLNGCVAPAPTTSAYEGKATRTAQDAGAQVQTARLAAGAALADRMPQAYLETVLSQAEDGFGSIQDTFDSVQPPDDPTADQLRDTLDTLLTAGSDGLGQLRIAARREDRAQVEATVRSLGPVAAALQRFAEEHA